MDFFTTKYEYIIVGGGISGLFLAYKLSNISDKQILLVEKTGRLGGRIHTYHNSQHDIRYETGAARFNINHTKLITLIKELGLGEKILELSLEATSILRNNHSDYPYFLKDTKLKLDFNSLINKVINDSNNKSKTYLINITFFQLCIDVLGYEGACYLKDIFGYSAEFIKGNAYAMLPIFRDNYLNPSKQQYYYLKDGLSQLVEKLHSYLKSCKNVTIKMDTVIEDINTSTTHMYYVETVDKQYYYTKNIILTIPQKSLLGLVGLKEITHLLNGVTPIPLCRIYALYDTCWYKDLIKTTTDNNIRYFIPIDNNDNKSLAMISYTDSEDASSWNNIYKISRELLIEHVHENLMELYPDIKIPKAIYYNLHFWDSGIHLWKPGVNPEKSYDRIMKPFPNKNVYIGGEAYSYNQGWIEGALDSCYDILKMLDLGQDYSVSVSVKGDLRTTKKEQVDDKVMVGNKDELKSYTIEHLREEMNKKNPRIIVMDFAILSNRDDLSIDDNNKYIYDVSGWFDRHPGGRDNLLEGIEANHIYLNNEYKGVSPIYKFLNISNHTSDLINIIEKYLINDNEYIKRIGILNK